MCCVELSYRVPCRILSLSIFTASTLFYVIHDGMHVDEWSRYAAYACLYALASFFFFSTWRDRLVLAYCKPRWLEDMERYRGPRVSESAIGMFGWCLAVCATIATCASIRGAKDAVEAVEKRSFVDIMAMVGGLLSLYASVSTTLGRWVFSLVLRVHDTVEAAHESSAGGGGPSPRLEPASSLDGGRIERAMSINDARSTCVASDEIRDFNSLYGTSLQTFIDETNRQNAKKIEMWCTGETSPRPVEIEEEEDGVGADRAASPCASPSS